MIKSTQLNHTWYEGLLERAAVDVFPGHTDREPILAGSVDGERHADSVNMLGVDTRYLYRRGHYRRPVTYLHKDIITVRHGISRPIPLVKLWIIIIKHLSIYSYYNDIIWGLQSEL